jgi:hypothetical protein
MSRQEAVRLDYKVVRAARRNLVEIVYLSDYRWKRIVGMDEICRGLFRFLETLDLDFDEACPASTPQIL